MFDNYEYCWRTGDYNGEDCEFCPHKSECSGYSDDTYDSFTLDEED